MPLRVRPLTEADTQAWAELYYPAFSKSDLGCLWIREPSVKSIRQLANVLKETLTKPDAHVFKCVDTDLHDKLIAVAKWSVYEEPRAMEQIEKTFVVRPTSVEENRKARIEFMSGIFKSRREIMGERPHVILDSLICHPDFQRRGAGRQLVQWGLDRADELGLPAYLEGSAAGKGLYRKMGYQPIREIIFDGRPYGAQNPDVHLVSTASFVFAFN
jgi:GNAT superfamily N-acetyltransferase